MAFDLKLRKPVDNFSEQLFSFTGSEGIGCCSLQQGEQVGIAEVFLQLALLAGIHRKYLWHW